MTGQMNQYTTDCTANASVFLFFAITHFLKQFYPAAQMTHLVLPKTQADSSQNQKSHFLPTHYFTFKPNNSK